MNINELMTCLGIMNNQTGALYAHAQTRKNTETSALPPASQCMQAFKSSSNSCKET